MSRLCQWYKGRPDGLQEQLSLGRNPAWADYQVLGPSFGAVSMLLGTQDILPVFVTARGCAYHTRFTQYAWGPDFGLVARPIPFLDFTRTQIVSGAYVAEPAQVQALGRLVRLKGSRLMVLLCGDDVALSGDDLGELSAELQAEIGIPAPVLRTSGISGANPWVGYDEALGLVYDQVWDSASPPSERRGVNLVGWKWPSREREHDIGACLHLLGQLDVEVNHVLPGGAALADFADSLRSRANVLWCSSYIGPTLERLEQIKGLRLAGHQTPYGFEGTRLWIQEVAAVLEDPHLVARGHRLADEHRAALHELQTSLRGKRAFVSGGPGRLMGLLHMLADFEVEVAAVGLYWMHPESRTALDQVLARFPRKPEVLVVSPSLYELDEIAKTVQPQVWLGGYQEFHICRRHKVPFVPTTLYVKSHQCFEGSLLLGQKMLEAMAGRDFVGNAFGSAEMHC